MSQTQVLHPKAVSSLGNRPTTATRRKVRNAANASAVAGGVVTIATWLLASRVPALGLAPAPVREAAELVLGGAVGAAVTGISSWWAGWATRPHLDETVTIKH
jgi:hypothetical protein